jgi:hypothetical protein
MKHFTYTTQETDHGLSYETIESLHVETIGYLTVINSNNSTEVKYSGNDATSNTGALLESILFINNAKRNSKTLKIDSTTHDNGVTTIKGTINIKRFMWGA